MKSLFFGGIHPADRKELSASAELKPVNQPKQVAIPMSQHIGNPCTPMVAVGDEVKKGQKIGDGEGLCVPVHASVSGKVIAVEPRRHPNGRDILSVVIENDFKDTMDTTMTAHEDYSKLSDDEIIDIIREAGIVGMGGATFATNIKAASSMEKVQTLIANACECEPYITADDMLLRTYPEQVLEGMRIICQVLNPERVVLAVEANKKRAIEVLKKELEGEERIELVVLPTRYPQGAEKQLIYAVTGREVPSGGLPAAVGCAVFNAATCKAIYDVVYEGMPLIKRIVTVSGDILMEPKNLLVPIGTSFDALIDACGYQENPYKVLSGGPMMGAAQYDLSVPTIKGVNAVTVLGKKNKYDVDEPHCLRCGKCIDACPMKLVPVLMYKALQSGEVQEMKDTNIMDCIECGSCAYTCPASVPLVLGFRVAKQRIRNDAAKQAAKK